MRRDMATWGRFGMAISLLAGVMVLGACGAGDDSSSSGGLAKASNPVNPSGDDGAAGDQSQAAPEASRAADDESSPKPEEKGSAVSTEGAGPHQGSESGNGETGSAKSGGAARDSRKVKPPHKGKSGGAVKPGKPTLPIPGQTSGDPYETARQICSDRELVEMIPPEYRDPEYLARTYADIYSPDNKQPAYEGCLAGLHSLGY